MLPSIVFFVFTGRTYLLHLGWFHFVPKRMRCSKSLFEFCGQQPGSFESKTPCSKGKACLQFAKLSRVPVQVCKMNLPQNLEILVHLTTFCSKCKVISSVLPLQNIFIYYLDNPPFFLVKKYTANRDTQMKQSHHQKITYNTYYLPPLMCSFPLYDHKQF